MVRIKCNEICKKAFPAKTLLFTKQKFLNFSFSNKHILSFGAYSKQRQRSFFVNQGGTTMLPGSEAGLVIDMHPFNTAWGQSLGPFLPRGCWSLQSCCCAFWTGSSSFWGHCLHIPDLQWTRLKQMLLQLQWVWVSQTKTFFLSCTSTTSTSTPSFKGRVGLVWILWHTSWV